MRALSPIMLFLILSCTPQHGSNTTALDLSNQKLSTIPDSVFSLTHLEYLNLGNRYTLYPPLSALGSDSESAKSKNKITEIPKDIERLSHLRTLGLCFNDLQSLPKEIVKLEILDTLDISFNRHLRLANELETLKKMHSLKYLNLVATNSDQVSIDELRKALPKTKIDTNLEDLKIETSE